MEGLELVVEDEGGVILLTVETEARAEQFQNAESPISVTPSGMSTEERASQP